LFALVVINSEPSVGKCYNSDCGCPDSGPWPSWCNVENYISGWCSESE